MILFRNIGKRGKKNPAYSAEKPDKPDIMKDAHKVYRNSPLVAPDLSTALY
ncbi:MAG: hypothetical protein AB7W47_17015 [Calditrichaceae bacterium]